MIKSTVGELLDDTLWDRAIAYHDTLSWDDADAVRNALCIYVVRDGETILYVGRSNSPVNRLYGHMGLTSRSSASGLGHLIKANLPESRDWQIELMSVIDCAPYIKAIYPNFILELCDAKAAEEATIKALHPCLNVIHNEHASLLPEHLRMSLSQQASSIGVVYNIPDFVEELQKELGTGY